MKEQTPYELIGREEGVKALTEAFYNAMDELPEAETLRGMHAKSLVNIKQKLFEYLNGWLGGPHLYKEKYGKICLTDPHRSFSISAGERDQWLICWDQALKKIRAPEEFKVMVKEPIYRMADFMINT